MLFKTLFFVVFCKQRPHFSCYGFCVLNSFVIRSNPIKV
ncbi:hypothetical protein HPNQ4099_0559 [Helicobacter pylori NQ4099]|uniref:Uncharacterized protein n=2 Tax=Helicobacter pylori TaxID=210 RepID=I9QB43_HELPX|nr:hypothetical protein HPNQ4099_0559 [Helicobacter pylori NQ4099]EJB34195.1 hypothetical protein HPNQ4076_0440 [Helicobacter pylori NQ4076]